MIKAVLIDLNGTVHVGNRALPGCIEALQKLRKVPGLNIRFVTNNSKESKQKLVARLDKMNFEIKPNEIFSALNATNSLMTNRKPFYFLTDDALKDMTVEQADPDSADTVVIGLAENRFDYENMNIAFRILKKPGAKMICCNVGRYHKTDSGVSLGPGAFSSGLTYSTSVEPTIVGKPNPLFYQAPLKELGLKVEQAVMIGDDARDDVNGAVAAGLKGILVKTGKFADGDEKDCDDILYCADDLSDAVDFLIKKGLV